MRVKRNGLTLVETAIAIAVLSVSALGTLSYQYYAARQSHNATAQLAATRIGQLLLEDWKSVGGKDDYNPTGLNLGFSRDTVGTGYIITVDGLRYYVSLDTPTDVDTDTMTDTTLRQIQCTVRWRVDLTSGSIRSTDPSLIFTTYVRRAQD
jgi:prepilin-type N-terminal cleavage/methylation domain-containing protein